MGVPKRKDCYPQSSNERQSTRFSMLTVSARTIDRIETDISEQERNNEKKAGKRNSSQNHGRLGQFGHASDASNHHVPRGG